MGLTCDCPRCAPSLLGSSGAARFAPGRFAHVQAAGPMLVVWVLAQWLVLHAPLGDHPGIPRAPQHSPSGRTDPTCPRAGT